MNRILPYSCRIHSPASPIESVTTWVQVSDELYRNVSGGTDLVSQCSCAVDTDLSLSLRSDCGLKVTGVCMESIQAKEMMVTLTYGVVRKTLKDQHRNSEQTIAK